MLLRQSATEDRTDDRTEDRSDDLLSFDSGVSMQRIIVKKGREYHIFRFEDVAYFYIENGLSFLVDRLTKLKYITARPLRNLETMTSGNHFFRANKKYLVNINAIVKFRPEKRGKLELTLDPDPKEPIVISQLKAHAFKEWVLRG